MITLQIGSYFLDIRISKTEDSITAMLQLEVGKYDLGGKKKERTSISKFKIYKSQSEEII